MSLGSGGGRSVCLWRCRLLSVPSGEQASRRRWDCSGLGHVARRCFGTKWYSEVPGALSTWDGDTGNEDDSSFARFFKLDKYAMFSFAMTGGLASDSNKIKIIITLRWAQKFGDTGPYKNLVFSFNPHLPKVCCNFSRNLASCIKDVEHKWVKLSWCINKKTTIIWFDQFNFQLLWLLIEKESNSKCSDEGL